MGAIEDRENYKKCPPLLVRKPDITVGSLSHFSYAIEYILSDNSRYTEGSTRADRGDGGWQPGGSMVRFKV